jgi:hypothetical protein
MFANGGWTRCADPEQYANYLEAEARRRNWFLDDASRHGKKIKMRRRVAIPIDIITVDFAPWLSDWILRQLMQGGDIRQKLEAIRNELQKAAIQKLTGKRYLLGDALHADTDDLHADFAVSRQDGLGGRVGIAGLRLAGPWWVGVDRQIRAGAVISPDKAAMLERASANFQRRYPGESPLDIGLARALDAAADQVVGARLVPFKEDYARRVPQLEEEHIKAKLREAKAAVRALEEMLMRHRQNAPRRDPRIDEIELILCGPDKPGILPATV